MRLWSLHPKYLDRIGLLALWRESLLAKKVLEGKSKGYKNHPQLIRFKSSPSPQDSINFYLNEILKEAGKRGYNFDSGKINTFTAVDKIEVSDKQIKYEFEHLLKKLEKRDINSFKILKSTEHIQPHPLFLIKKGPIEAWERSLK